MTWLLVTRRPFWPSFGALSLFPGIHIAQFPFQVIGNCGVISLMQCSKRDKVKISTSPDGAPTNAPTKLRSRTVNVRLSRGTSPAIAGWRYAQYDGIVALAACEHFCRGPGMSSMMVVLLIAGLGLVLAGLLTVGFGVQVDLSFGNTLILAGAIAACTGMILLGIWTVVRELKNIARRLVAGVAVESNASLQPAAENAGNVVPEPIAQPASPLPWHEEATSRDRMRGDVPSASEPVEAAPAL